MVAIVVSLLLSVAAYAAEPPSAVNSPAPKAAMIRPVAAWVPAVGRSASVGTDNAALVYCQAWLVESPETLARLTTEFCPPGGECRLRPDWEPDEEIDKALVAAQIVIGKLLAAGAIDACDFGNDVSEGPELRLPHLARMRGSARLLCADAVRLMLAGDSDGAAERVAGQYALSRHAIDGHTYIASLVSAHIGGVADDTAVRLCAGGLTAKGRERILSAIGRSDAADPFGCKRGIAGERALLLNWLRTLTGPDAGQRLVRSSLLESIEPQAEAEFVAAVSPLDGAGVQTLANGLGEAYAEAITVWDQPDGEQRIKEIRSKAGRGEFGALAKALVPALGSIAATDRVGRESRAETITKLRGVGVE